MVTINRLKAMIELRKIDEGVAKEKSEGKTDWSQDELNLIKEKQDVLNRIIEEGSGEYDESKYGEIERGYSGPMPQ